jgi:hypothetical protein
MTCGDEGRGFSFVICFVPAHEYINETQQARINAERPQDSVREFRSMMNWVFKKETFKGRIKKGKPLMNRTVIYNKSPDDFDGLNYFF